MVVIPFGVCELVLSNSSIQSSLCVFFINVTLIKKKRNSPCFCQHISFLSVDQCICWRCRTASVWGWMWQLSGEVGGALLRPDGRCDQACFSASPLAPIGVTMLHLACESSQGRDRNHSRGGGLLLWVWVKGGGDKLHLLVSQRLKGSFFCIWTWGCVTYNTRQNVFQPPKKDKPKNIRSKKRKSRM